MPSPRRFLEPSRPAPRPLASLFASAALSLALAAGCAATAPDPSASTKPTPPSDVGDKVSARFLSSAAQGNTDNAYGQLCETVRRHLSIEAFARALEAQPLLTNGSMVSLIRTETKPDGSIIRRGSLLASSGKIPLEIFLAKEDGAWCLTGISLDGQPALSGGSNAGPEIK